jgi:hypothetical protein
MDSVTKLKDNHFGSYMLSLDAKELGYGARFLAEIYDRGCHWCEHACDQEHASRESTFLLVDTVNSATTLKVFSVDTSDQVECPLPLTLHTFHDVTTLKVFSIDTSDQVKCPLPLTVHTFHDATTLKVFSIDTSGQVKCPLPLTLHTFHDVTTLKVFSIDSSGQVKNRPRLRSEHCRLYQ